MVNFRYHLVSITAVFLALAIGLVLGVAVVNSGAVDRLEGQLDAARTARAQDEQLRRDLDSWRSFADKAGPSLVAERLEDVPVLLIGVRGMDADPVGQLRETLVDADARVQATLWLTSKLRLERPDDVRSMADALDLPDSSPEIVRAAAFSRLATELVTAARTPPRTDPTATSVQPTTTLGDPLTTTTTEPDPRTRNSVLAALIRAGFIDVDDPAGGRFDPTRSLPEGTRFVVASGVGADVPDEVGATALVQSLVTATPRAFRIVAVEPGRSAAGREPEQRGTFIVPLRATSGDVDRRVSTVNDIEDFRGRVAAVLALAELGLGRVGHYGQGPGAERLVPETG